MMTPTDIDLAHALRELIPYAAECAACPGYRIKNARAALAAHESRAAEPVYQVRHSQTWADVNKSDYDISKSERRILHTHPNRRGMLCKPSAMR